MDAPQEPEKPAPEQDAAQMERRFSIRRRLWFDTLRL
jgi:hypothetical protein